MSYKFFFLGILFLFASVKVNSQTQEVTPISTDSISNSYVELDEFVLEVKKELVTSDGAKLTYDLDSDESSKGQSVLDALRKVPMVSVDGQDNIYIQGNQNFRIYVNGKEEPMLTANASRILKAMPAESVSKIEVLTEPGAKYDAEGIGGILNLITERKQRKDGYAGSAGLSFSSQNAGANLYGKVKYNKITADASLNFANNAIQRQSQYSSTETIDFSSDEYYRSLNEMIQSFKYNYVGAALNFSWEPTDNNLFTFGANLNALMAIIDKLHNKNSMFNKDNLLDWVNLQMITGTMKNIGASGNTSYRRIFSKTGNSLTLAYRFNFGYNPWDLDYENSSEIGDYKLPLFQKNKNTTFQREHTVTADYEHPFSDDKHKIETGIKGIFRNNSQTSEMVDGDNDSELIPIEDDMGKINQKQNIYALYVVYNGNLFDKISLTAGLRYEHTLMSLEFPTGNYENFNRHLNDIVPNASLTYKFGAANNVRISYQMRINRPSVNQMNPTEFRITQNFVQVGNPELQSERYNTVSLSYSNYGRVIGGNVGLNFYQSNNTIEDYEFFKNGVNYTTFGNFGKNRKAELSGFLNWNITGKMSVSFNASLNYTIIKSGNGELSNHGWNGSYGINYNYAGPWNIKYSAYGGQSTGMVRLQGKFYGWYYYGLGLSRSFLKEKTLTIAINANNFFTKYSHFRNKTWSDNHISNFRNKNRSWNVGISLSWNFGHLQDQVKKTNANLESNDSKVIGKGGQSGLGL